MVEAGQGCYHGRGRISLYQDQMGLGLFQHPRQASHRPRSERCRALVVLHEIQVDVWPDDKKPQHLIEHLSVLGSHTDQ